MQLAKIVLTSPLDAFDIGFNHFRHQRFETGLRLPAEFASSFRRIAEQDVDVGRPHEARVDRDVFLHVQADELESQLAKIPHAGATAGRDDVVVRLRLLQHQPHGLDIVAGVAPVAFRVQVPQRQLVLQAELDADDTVGDLAGDELDATQRRFMVEQDAARRMQAVALAVIHRQPVGVEFCHRIRRARVEWRLFALDRLLNETEHLRRRRLVEVRVRTGEPHGLEHIGGTDAGDLRGQERLPPGRLHEGLRGEIIDLGGLYLLDDPDQRRQVGHVSVVQSDPVDDAEPLQALADNLRRSAAAQDPVHLVALVEEKLRKIRAVLAGDAADQSHT